MRLHDLYADFMEMSEEEQLSFFHDFYEERSRVLQETILVKAKTPKSPTARKQDKKLTVTPDQLILLRRLGLV